VNRTLNRRDVATRLTGPRPERSRVEMSRKGLKCRSIGIDGGGGYGVLTVRGIDGVGYTRA
jgi:hypothetical protein